MAQWRKKAQAQAQSMNLAPEEKRLYPLSDIFSKLKALVTRCGVAYVVGVIDAKTSNDNKVRRGNSGVAFCRKIDFVVENFN